METRGDMRHSSGSREHSFGRRLRVGAAGTIVVGGAIFLGGAASLVTAFANTGHVMADQTCTGWSASATLDDNVTNRLVTVTFPDTGTTVQSGVYSTDGTNGSQKGSLQIWSDSGTNQQTGTVTLTIYNNSTGTNGVDGSPYTATLQPASNCNSAISTTPSAGGIVGTAIHDSAIVTGSLGSPSGTVLFKLFPPTNATCNSDGDAAVFTSAPISLTSVTPGTSHAADSGSFTTTAIGVYHWVAVYSGDTTYKGATSNCADEAVTTSQAAPSIATTASAGGTAPIDVTDSAKLSGGNSPTGSITFTLYPSTADCTSGTNALYTSSAEALSGGKATSGAFSATTAGTFQWIAKYSGDTNNASVSSTCGDEPVTTTSGGGGILAITTPGTGGIGSLTGITLGGFLLLGGLGVALVGAIVPRRRRIQ